MINYKLPPVKERFLSRFWLVFSWLAFTGGSVLILAGLGGSLNQGVVNVTKYWFGFAVLFFSGISAIRNIRYLRKYCFERTYHFDDAGVTIAYAYKQEKYLWQDVKLWVEEDGANLIDLDLKNGKTILLEVPHEHFDEVANLLNNHIIHRRIDEA